MAATSKFKIDPPDNLVIASGQTALPLATEDITNTFTSPDSITDISVIETDVTQSFKSDPAITVDGKFTDTTGGGFPSPPFFAEVNPIVMTAPSTILGRLQYTAPTLNNGESIEDTVTVFTFVSTDATKLTPSPDAAGGKNFISTSFLVDVVTAPGITGSVPNQPDGDASLQPFGTLKIRDTDFKNTGTDTATITVSDPAGTPTDADGLLTGVGLAKTGVGTYSIPNAVAPGVLTTVLQNLKFTPVVGVNDTTTNFEVDTTDVKANLTSKDTTTSVLTMGTGKGPPPPGDLTVFDTTTNTTLATQPPAVPAEGKFTGTIAGIDNQYINITQDSLNITAKTPNWFLHSGSGVDAIQAFGGTNVLDGGTNSNFEVGATGASKDTFFVDNRDAPADIWSTMVNFHSGDDATMFGVTQAGFNIAVVNSDGAAGFTGLTFHVTAAGKPEASLTLAGFTQADLTSGKLTQTFGTEADGTPFMLIHGT